MSKNSSSLNGSLLHPHLSPLEQEFPCHISGPSSFILTTYCITNVSLLLPLCTFILHSGFRPRCPGCAPPRRAISHSDCFTYHLAAMELINVVNCISHCCGVYREDKYQIFAGGFLTSLTWHGQTFFHALTCLEHYLAVVHPILYLSLRNERGVRFRNITVLCVWVLSFVGMGLMAIKQFLALVDLSILVGNLAVMLFCSLSVLFSLYRPGPAGKEAGKKRVHQAKQRAFTTVLIIMIVQTMRFVGSVIWTIVDVAEHDSYCLMVALGVMINLPSSLVLPLLFLQREGTFVRCEKICFLRPT